MVYIGMSPSGYGACFGSRITEVRVLSFRLSLMLKKAPFEDGAFFCFIRNCLSAITDMEKDFP